MAADWLTIRNDYINGGGSYRQLAEKYGVPFSTLRDQAIKGKWKQAKDEHRNNIVKETERKAAERISDSEAEIAAIHSRVRLNIMKQLESRLGKEKLDGMEFRRLVQSYKDMCEITEGIGSTEETDDGFLDALNGTAGEDWSDESDIPV